MFVLAFAVLFGMGIPILLFWPREDFSVFSGLLQTAFLLFYCLLWVMLVVVGLIVDRGNARLASREDPGMPREVLRDLDRRATASEPVLVWAVVAVTGLCAVVFVLTLAIRWPPDPAGCLGFWTLLVVTAQMVFNLRVMAPRCRREAEALRAILREQLCAGSSP